jgi:EpsI family protein
MSRHLVITILLLTATLALARIAADRKPEPLAQPLETISRTIQGYIGIDDAALPDETIHALNATSYLSRTYRKANGADIDLFIAFYAQQRAGESMHSPKHCLPGAGWEIWDYGRTFLTVGGRNYEVNKYSISRESQRMLVLYWYQSKERIVASEYMGKILLARDTLLRQATAGSIVRVIVPDQAGMLETGRAFAAHVLPEVQRCFGHYGR